MKKGNFGFYLWLYPAAAFAVCVTGQILLIAALLGFVLAAEKHEETGMQVMQAFFLCTFYNLLMFIVRWACAIFGVIPFFGATIQSGLYGIIEFFAQIILVLTCLKAILAIKNDRALSIPWATKFVDKAYGKTTSCAYPTSSNVENGTWTCSSCSQINSGNFCEKCGHPRQ